MPNFELHIDISAQRQSRELLRNKTIDIFNFLLKLGLYERLILKSELYPEDTA